MSNEKVSTFDELFQNGLECIYDAEKQLTETLPKMAQAAHSSQLRQAFEQHLKETRNHVQRIEYAFSKLGLNPASKTSIVLQAMRKETEKMIENTEASPIRDAALIMAGTQVEHWEMASYGSLRNFAELMGEQSLVSLMQQTLDEEKKADQKLTQVGASEVNPQAAQRRGQLTR
jgi:ferritin-like metal-binding protein YciE